MSIILLFTLLYSGSTVTNDKIITEYNLTSPDVFLVLPDILREISGLTSIDSTSVACIQDDNGILFIYDIIKNKIKKQYTFSGDGDYEGIARVHKTIYVLRSDGTLFEISEYESNDFHLTTYATGIPSSNNEGLCYDQNNNRLLIACKGKFAKGHTYKDKRAIYAFDLQSKTLSKKPVFVFDLQEIKEFALENNIHLPTRTKKKGQITESSIKLKISAICIHPLTKRLFLLSASDHLLCIFNMNSDLEHVEQLNPALFNKAEGITFLENGDMLISNEGQSKKPTVLRFNYRKK